MNNNHPERFQGSTKTQLVPVTGEHLLWEGWWHGIGDHWWWSWWLLALLWRRWLRVERERWMIHSILSRPLHAPEVGGALEALITEGTHLIG